jgi:hypothetical protein
LHFAKFGNRIGIDAIGAFLQILTSLKARSGDDDELQSIRFLRFYWSGKDRVCDRDGALRGAMLLASDFSLASQLGGGSSAFQEIRTCGCLSQQPGGS